MTKAQQDINRKDAANLVCAYRRAHAAAADRYSALNLQRSYGQCQRNDIVGIVVALAQAMSAEVNDLMPRGPKLAEQFFLQTKSILIGGNSNAHIFSLSPSRLVSLTTKGSHIFDYKLRALRVLGVQTCFSLFSCATAAWSARTSAL